MKWRFSILTRSIVILVVISLLLLWNFLMHDFAEIHVIARLRNFLESYGLLSERPQVQFFEQQISPGDYIPIYVSPIQEQDVINVKATFSDVSPWFFSYGKGKVSFLPVDYRTDPGTYVVEIIVTRRGHAIIKTEHNLVVTAKDFAVQRLYVSSELQAKRDEDLWDEDRLLTTKARAHSNPQPLWDDNFVLPVKGEITTDFGQIRYINDQESGRHSGFDIAAPIGTPIIASNSGVITLAQQLHVTGNTVVIDHGLNLFTSYSHLDRIHVKPGQKVTKGEKIGTVGSTGFSTGPHLHWSVVIGSVFVNPRQVIEVDPLLCFHE